MLIIIACVFALFLSSLAFYIATWAASHSFGDWGISYKDFRRWYEMDPARWELFDSSNVRFLGDRFEQSRFCYFGFIDLAKYMVFYHNKTKRTRRNHRKSDTRERIESVYRRMESDGAK